MAINSRSKGKNGELELAKVLREAGFPLAARGQQFKGSADSPDIVGIPGVHVENKRTEKLSLYDALDQSVRDAGDSGRVPIVVHRRNKPRGNAVTTRGRPVVVMLLDDWVVLYKLAHPEIFLSSENLV